MANLDEMLWMRFDKIEERFDNVQNKQAEIVEKIGDKQDEVVKRVGDVEKTVAGLEGEVKGLRAAIDGGGTNIEVNATGQDQSSGPIDNSVSTANTITASGNVQGVNAQSDGGAKSAIGQVSDFWNGLSGQNRTMIMAAAVAGGLYFQDTIKERIGLSPPPSAQSVQPATAPASLPIPIEVGPPS